MLAESFGHPKKKSTLRCLKIQNLETPVWLTHSSTLQEGLLTAGTHLRETLSKLSA